MFVIIYVVGVCLFLLGTLLTAMGAAIFSPYWEFFYVWIGAMIPFPAMNFGMGLTKVRFWDYFSGTALGILVGTFVFTFFVGMIKDVWAGRHWEEFLN